MQVTHKEEPDRLVIAIDGKQFYLYDKSVEEIGQALFQAFQAGARSAILGLGCREVVVDAFFDAYFDHVQFDFGLPMDIRIRDIERLVMLSGATDDPDTDSTDG